MRIIKHINPNYPNKPIYRCKIDNVTASRFDYNEIVAWKDERLANSSYYQELKQLNNLASQAYYDDTSFNYKGD